MPPNINRKTELGKMAFAYNHSNLGIGDWKDLGSRPVRAKC
jgi:hypothetical protein